VACGCDAGLIILDRYTFRRHNFVPDEAVFVAFSPDSRLLAFPSIHAGVVRLWDVALNREVAVLRHPGEPCSVAFSGDGRLLVTAGNRSVRIWRLSHTKEKLMLQGHTGGVPGVAFSPDGKLLASAIKDQTVKIWNPMTGQVVKDLTGFPGAAQTVAFSADGRLLAVGDYAGTIKICGGDSWEELATVDHALGSVIWAVAFSHDGKHFAAGGLSGLTLWRVVSDAGSAGIQPRLVLQPIPPVSQGFVGSLRFSPDSKLLAWTEGREQEGVTVHLWDLANSQKLPGPPSRSASTLIALSFSPDSKHLVFVNEQCEIEKWNLATGQKAASFGSEELRRGNPPRTALSGDGALFAAGSSRSVTVWDMEHKKLLLDLPEERGPIWSVAWSPNRELLAVGSSDGGLVIWNIPEIRAQLATIGLDW
jgi:WD40 repeat protein